MDQFDQGTNKTALPGNLDSLDWSTKLKDLLPEDWKLLDEWANEKADIRDILAHRSGLPRCGRKCIVRKVPCTNLNDCRHDPSYGRTESARDVVRNLRNLKPAYELREHYHYNNQVENITSFLSLLYNETLSPDVRHRLLCRAKIRRFIRKFCRRKYFHTSRHELLDILVQQSK